MSSTSLPRTAVACPFFLLRPRLPNLRLPWQQHWPTPTSPTMPLPLFPPPPRIHLSLIFSVRLPVRTYYNTRPTLPNNSTSPHINNTTATLSTSRTAPSSLPLWLVLTRPLASTARCRITTRIWLPADQTTLPLKLAPTAVPITAVPGALRHPLGYRNISARPTGRLRRAHTCSRVTAQRWAHADLAPVTPRTDLIDASAPTHRQASHATPSSHGRTTLRAMKIRYTMPASKRCAATCAPRKRPSRATML